MAAVVQPRLRPFNSEFGSLSVAADVADGYVAVLHVTRSDPVPPHRVFISSTFPFQLQDIVTIVSRVGRLSRKFDLKKGPYCFGSRAPNTVE